MEDLEAVTDAVMAASRVLVKIAARSLSEVGEEVTLPQFRALVVLQSRGPQSARVLAEELEIAPSTLTRLGDRLVAKGLVARGPVVGDRREVHLRVTDEGARIVGSVSRRRREALRSVVSALPAPDQQVLVRVLEAFAAAAGEVPEYAWYLAWD